MMMMESKRMVVRMVLCCVRDDEEEQGGHIGVAVLFLGWEKTMRKKERAAPLCWVRSER